MGERRTHIGPWTVTVTQDMMPIYSSSPTPDEQLCHETISPGTKPPSPFPTYIPGMQSAIVVVDDARLQKTWEVEMEVEFDLLRTDPVAGIATVTQREPVSRSFSG